MGTFIDRNPEQMIKYATDARNVIGEMTMTIRKVEGLLDAYAPDLDDPTQKQIQELHTCCSNFFRQIETYQKIADSVYTKGKRLSDIRSGG